MSWYVIQVMTSMENACVELMKQQIDSSFYEDIFVPKRIVKRHVKKQWLDKKEILFPGYVFVQTNHIDDVKMGLSNVQHFTKVLCSAEQMTPITEEEEAFLRELLDENYIVHCSEGLIVGDKICITTGPLMNLCGYIKKVDRHRRIAKLEVEIFGRMTPMEVELGVVARVTEEEFKLFKKKRQEENDKRTRQEENKEVEIISGVFKGLTGTLLSEDEKKDKYILGLNVFDNLMKVEFEKHELLL